MMKKLQIGTSSTKGSLMNICLTNAHSLCPTDSTTRMISNSWLPIYYLRKILYIPVYSIQHGPSQLYKNRGWAKWNRRPLNNEILCCWKTMCYFLIYWYRSISKIHSVKKWKCRGLCARLHFKMARKGIHRFACTHIKSLAENIRN